MATNYKNTNIVNITTDTTFPTFTTGTGTISIVAGSRDVSGVNTLFTTELKPKDWIVDLTNHEMRRVTSVGSATACNIDHPFTNDLVGATARYIASSRVVSLMAISPSAGGKIDTITMPTDNWVNYDKTSRSRSANFLDFCDPIFVDGTGSNVIIMWEL